VQGNGVTSVAQLHTRPVVEVELPNAARSHGG
jgi:hypothetical protein